MAKLDDITYEIHQKRWVRPLAYFAAFLLTLTGKSRFPRWLTDFILEHGYKIEWKK